MRVDNLIRRNEKMEKKPPSLPNSKFSHILPLKICTKVPFSTSKKRRISKQIASANQQQYAVLVRLATFTTPFPKTLHNT